MAFPKWKYTVEKGTNAFRASLVGTAEAEKELGAAWVDDPTSLGVEVVPCGGPHDAAGKVGFGPAPIVPGITKSKIG